MNSPALHSRAPKRRRALDGESDKTKFSNVELTKERKNKVLKGELLYFSKNTDMTKINFGEIKTLVDVGDLNFQGKEEEGERARIYAKKENEKRFTKSI